MKKQLTLTKPMQVTMPESLYSVVYTETAFKGLTQHPSHFHTIADAQAFIDQYCACLLYTSPSPRDGLLSRMPSSA